MIVVRFLLLGQFECEAGTPDRKPLGDTIAAKILAFLAYRGRFCSRDEIVQAVWGSHRVTGRERVDDDAYFKQISNVRAIFTDRLGLPWQDYVLTQPNGAELKEEMFSTDTSQFSAFVAAGLDSSLPAADRLAALQEAESLRRGYFLDGMNCEWIVSQEGGARRDWSARVMDVRREIARLQSSQDAPGSRKVTCYPSFYDLLPVLRKSIDAATEELIFYGLNFHVTIPFTYDALLGCLKRGVKVKFLMLDPGGNWCDVMARTTAADLMTLQAEGIVSLRKLMDLDRRFRAAAMASESTEGLNDRLSVALFDDVLHSSVYAIDPNLGSGELFYFPYMHGVTSSCMPGYHWPHEAQGPFNSLTSELRRLMESADNKPIVGIESIPVVGSATRF